MKRKSSKMGGGHATSAGHKPSRASSRPGKGRGNKIPVPNAHVDMHGLGRKTPGTLS